MQTIKPASELFTERLNILPKEIINLVKSNKIKETVTNISQLFSLNEAKSNILSTEIILSVLAFSPIDKLAINLEEKLEVDKMDSEQMFTIINHTLFLPLEDIYEVLSTKLVSFDLEEVNSSLAKINTEQDIKTTEVSSDGAGHIRTMAEDMIKSGETEEVVYSSTQSAILNESKPKTEEVNSWGSEDK